MIEPQKDSNDHKDTGISVPEASSPFNPAVFHNDQEVLSLYKKIEAVCGAIFLVTNLIPESDIIKDTLRQQCLLSLNHAVGLMAPTVNVTAIQSIASDMVHIHSLLDVAFWSGAVSQMNSSVIQREINAIQLAAGSLVDKYKNRFFLDPAFFNQPAQPVVKKEVPTSAFSQPVKKEERSSEPVYKGQPKGQPKGQYIKDATSANVRREAILKLLGERSDLGIKDFAAIITGYSEKTIQRELLALVAEGVVKKQGERRWSTYSLKT